jgi:hypothetical protein
MHAFRWSNYSTEPLIKALDVSATPDLLNTNEPPDDSEYAFIHSACLDGAMSEIQETLRLLEERNATLTRYRTR